MDFIKKKKIIFFKVYGDKWENGDKEYENCMLEQGLEKGHLNCQDYESNENKCFRTCTLRNLSQVR